MHTTPKNSFHVGCVLTETTRNTCRRRVAGVVGHHLARKRAVLDRLCIDKHFIPSFFGLESRTYVKRRQTRMPDLRTRSSRQLALPLPILLALTLVDRVPCPVYFSLVANALLRDGSALQSSLGKQFFIRLVFPQSVPFALVHSRAVPSCPACLCLLSSTESRSTGTARSR